MYNWDNLTWEKKKVNLHKASAMTATMNIEKCILWMGQKQHFIYPSPDQRGNQWFWTSLIITKKFMNYRDISVNLTQRQFRLCFWLHCVKFCLSYINTHNKTWVHTLGRTYQTSVVMWFLRLMKSKFVVFRSLSWNVSLWAHYSSFSRWTVTNLWAFKNFLSLKILFNLNIVWENTRYL